MSANIVYPKVVFMSDDMTEYDKNNPVIAKLDRNASPFRFPGGKSGMVRAIAERLDPKRNIFVEACAGGASVGLALLKAGLIDKLVLNDKDPNIYAFWEMAAHDGDMQLLQMLHLNPEPTHDDFYDAKTVLFEPMKNSKKDKFRHAWAQLLVNRLAFGGCVLSGPMSGANGSDEAMRARWNAESLKQKLLDIYKLGDKIKVTNMDVCDVFGNYQQRLARHATIFVDPPKFIEKGSQLYPVTMTRDEHERLKDVINNYCGDANIIAFSAF